MDISLHRARLDHDSWPWFLLLGIVAEEECSFDDLHEYDIYRGRLIPGLSTMFIDKL